MAPPADVPELVRQRALAHEREGREWLEHLPDVVASLAERWGLHLGQPYVGGTAGFVVGCVDAGGRDCVLKVAMDLDGGVDGFARSVVVHRLADGQGCAELLAHDDDARALLLERLGPNLHDLAMPIPDVLDTIVATLRQFWRPCPATCGLPTGAAGASWLADHITTAWDQLGRPCPRGVIERAVACCDERAAAFDEAAAVLVHGDAHGWNTLAVGGGTYKFVDPEGLRSEPAHDLAVPMREYNEPLLAGDTARLVEQRAERLASACGIDPAPVWQWGFIERVSTGLVLLRDLPGGAGEAFLEVARRCC